MKAISMTHTHHLPARTWMVRALAGLLGAAAVLAAFPQKADAGVFIGVGVSVGVPPPPLPVYAQPIIPGPGYIWTPGYWAWDGYEYYWVPGTWIMAPFYGALWTPGYWGWDGAVFLFHPGYWGYHVGFYGGINYGFGYTGVGYAGGYWGHGGFYYNHSVNRFGNVHIINVYNRTVINNVTRVSYNGGRGGMVAHATAQDMAFAHQARMGPIAAQQQQAALASHNPAMRMSVNHGAPTIAATARPGAFAGAGVVSAHGAVAGRFTPAAASVHSMSVVHAPASAQHSTMALHSASYAPHTSAGAYHPGASAYHPSAGAYHPGSAHGATHAMNTYRPASNAYHAAPAPAYRAAQPQYHASRPAAAPRSAGAPHGGGGGGHEPSHHG